MIFSLKRALIYGPGRCNNSVLCSLRDPWWTYWYPLGWILALIVTFGNAPWYLVYIILMDIETLRHDFGICFDLIYESKHHYLLHLYVERIIIISWLVPDTLSDINEKNRSAACAKRVDPPHPPDARRV